MLVKTPRACIFVCVFTREGFFESLAAEAKLDAEKSVMLKNAVHARKVIVRRAQTMQYETLRKQRESSSFFCLPSFSQHARCD